MREVGDSGAGLRELEQATHVMSSIPPVGDFDRDPVMAAHAMDLRQLAWRSRGPGLLWAGYLSSTIVYGDWQGAWVDERCLGPLGLCTAVCTAKGDWQETLVFSPALIVCCFRCSLILLLLGLRGDCQGAHLFCSSTHLLLVLGFPSSSYSSRD